VWQRRLGEALIDGRAARGGGGSGEASGRCAARLREGSSRWAGGRMAAADRLEEAAGRRRGSRMPQDGGAARGGVGERAGGQ
jgi:hypothetical protein